MNFSGISNRSRLGAAIRLPLRLLPSDLVVPIVQGPSRGSKWIIGSSNHGCWLGSYEYQKRITFARFLTTGDTVYDIGAHVGFYSVLAASLVGQSGSVYAFEPYPRNIAYLRRHVDMNHLDQVKVVELAVSDRTGVAHFSQGASSSMGSLSSDGGYEVGTVSLDDWVFTQHNPVPKLLKIDVEGGEGDVLRGAKSILSTVKPVIFLATHGPSVHGVCVEMLQRAGYLLESLDSDDLDDSSELLALPG